MSKLRIKASVKGGALFKAETRVDFLTVTSRMYGHMKDRPVIKAAGGVPFTLEQFRQDVLSVMGTKDGVLQCRYCRGHFTIGEVAADHAIPLSRAGGFGLDNLDYPCRNCNQAKGSMKPQEFTDLIEFLERKLPDARTDVLGRLAKAVSLAAAARRAQTLARAATRPSGPAPSVRPPASQLQLTDRSHVRPEDPF